MNSWVGYGCVHRRGEQGVRKLEAAEAAVLEDLLGEETTTRQAARIVFCLSLQDLQVQNNKGSTGPCYTFNAGWCRDHQCRGSSFRPAILGTCGSSRPEGFSVQT